MLKAQFFGSRLAAGSQYFWLWWIRQIRSLAPSPPESTAPDALIIEIEKTECLSADISLNLAAKVFERRRGTEVLRGSFDQVFQHPASLAVSSPVSLRLPPEMVLLRQAVFPSMAQHHLQTAIAFEMDRLTPFSEREVYWSLQEVTRGQKNLKLTILIVPRSLIETLLTSLARQDLFPSFIESSGGYISLAHRIKPPTNKLQRTLLGLCCALTLALFTIPVAYQQDQLFTVGRQIQKTMPEQQEMVSLRHQLANFDDGHTVNNAAQKTGDELQTLALLTNALPDGTWLTQLGLSRDDITISGQSTNAANLIAALAVYPGLNDPSFTAPVTRIPGSRADMFSINILVSK